MAVSHPNCPGCTGKECGHDISYPLQKEEKEEEEENKKTSRK
jgi:hypothetical protein